MLNNSINSLCILNVFLICLILFIYIRGFLLHNPCFNNLHIYLDNLYFDDSLHYSKDIISYILLFIFDHVILKLVINSNNLQ